MDAGVMRGMPGKLTAVNYQAVLSRLYLAVPIRAASDGRGAHSLRTRDCVSAFRWWCLRWERKVLPSSGVRSPRRNGSQVLVAPN